MELRTYRAASLQDALQLVRQELGPDAAVLHTREVRGGVLRWLSGRQIEVTASAGVYVPSRFSDPEPGGELASDDEPPDYGRMAASTGDAALWSGIPRADAEDCRAKFRDDLRGEIADLRSLVEDLCRRSAERPRDELPEALFQLFTDLIDAEVGEELARELVERVRTCEVAADPDQPYALQAALSRLVESEIACRGPIQVERGRCRLVALVGPTGVGKTTTIAKLAANFHLRERFRVGLITVDTYRIAAVDQLRTYADIIDLPMEVVSTPREMRTAVERLADFDLVLMDTAGRSPRDEVRIQELKTMLTEAQADEVHVVLSSVGGSASMTKAAERFAEVGATSLLLTKLDEATGLGGLLPLLRSCRLPLSYLTNGQNVPDDILAAESGEVARMILRSEN